MPLSNLNCSLRTLCIVIILSHFCNSLQLMCGIVLKRERINSCSLSIEKLYCLFFRLKKGVKIHCLSKCPPTSNFPLHFFGLDENDGVVLFANFLLIFEAVKKRLLFRKRLREGGQLPLRTCQRNVCLL